MTSRPTCENKHDIFGVPFDCSKYQELTGMPCPDTEEGKRAHQAVSKAADEIKIVDEASLGKNSIESEPFDPYCNRFASQIPEMVAEAEYQEMTPAELARDDGTFNTHNGHFAGNECYIKLGMPSSPTGWSAR
jgi:hypothetical protein